MNTRDNWGIVGHEWAVRSLRRAVASDIISHAYLLTGPPSVGKTTLTRALAAALLCQAAVEARPCSDCRACRLVASGNHTASAAVATGSRFHCGLPALTRKRLIWEQFAT